jgi:hypothetical protein
MDNLPPTNQPPASKVEEIRNRFKVVGAPSPAVTPEKKDEKEIAAISARAKEKEKFYSDVGEGRAAAEKDKEKKEKAEIADRKFKQTTIRLYTHMLKGIYEVEGKLLGEDVVLNYEDIMTAGIEKLKEMPADALVSYLKLMKKR